METTNRRVSYYLLVLDLLYSYRTEGANHQRLNLERSVVELERQGVFSNEMASQRHYTKEISWA